MSAVFKYTCIAACILMACVLAGFWHYAVQTNAAKIQAEGRASSLDLQVGLLDIQLSRADSEIFEQDIQLSRVRAELERCEGNLYVEMLARNVCARVVAIETVEVEGSVRK